MSGEIGQGLETENIPSLAAIWVYRRDTAGLSQFLLVQRSAASLEPDYPGLWGIITQQGGTLADNKPEPISTTALRGIASEISADGKAEESDLRPLTGEIIYGDGVQSMRMQLFLARSPQIRLNPQELQNYRWGTAPEIRQFYVMQPELFVPNFTFALRILEEAVAAMVL